MGISFFIYAHFFKNAISASLNKPQTRQTTTVDSERSNEIENSSVWRYYDHSKRSVRTLIVSNNVVRTGNVTSAVIKRTAMDSACFGWRTGRRT